MNPSTRRYVFIIAAAMVLGALIGLSAGASMSIITIPGYENMPLTVDERESLERLEEVFWFVSGEGFSYMIRMEMVIFILAAALLLKVLNPHAWTKKAFNSWTGRLKLLVAFVVSIGSVPVLLNLSSYASIALGLDLTELMLTGVKELLVLSGIFALMWLVAGEQGWAGDLSTWKMRQRERFRPSLSLALGVCFSMALWASNYLMNIATEGLYAFLYSGSEAERFTLQRNIMMLSSFSLDMVLRFGIFFGIASALAPAHLRGRERRRRFIFPAVLLVASVALLFPASHDGRQAYRVLEKGIDGLSEEPRSYSAIIFRQDDDRQKRLQEVTNTVMSFSGMGAEDIPVTKENVELIDKYIQENINTMPFASFAMQTRSEMLYKLWRPVEARESYFSDRYFDITPRQKLFSQLHRGMPALEAEKYIEEFSNERKWSLGKHYTYSLAHAFAHYGHPEKALMWKEKAQEMGADVSKLDIPETLPLLNGTVTGRIVSEDVDFDGTRLGLFWLWEGDNYHITGISEYGPTDLMQSVDLGPDGTFTFNEVHEGAYYLALKLETEGLPEGASNETIRLLNSPGVFFINTTNPEAALGTIEIRFETEKP